MKMFTVIAALILSASPASAASPAVSRGEELLAMSFEDCIARARTAFLEEGFKITTVDNTSYVLARKGIHNAYITCSPAPADKTWANVFVASYTQDGKIPGAERSKLQLRMAAAAPLVDFTGTWTVSTQWGSLAIEQSGDQLTGRFFEPPGSFTGKVYGDTALLDFKDDAGTSNGRAWLRLTSTKALGGRWCVGSCDPKKAEATFIGRRK